MVIFYLVNIYNCSSFICFTNLSNEKEFYIDIMYGWNLVYLISKRVKLKKKNECWYALLGTNKLMFITWDNQWNLLDKLFYK